MEKEKNRDRERRGVNHDCKLYSGGKLLGAKYKIFADSVRFYHVTRNGVKVLDRMNEEDRLKRGGQFLIYWEMSLVCIQCYQRKKFVSEEGCFMGTPYCEWLHSW